MIDENSHTVTIPYQDYKEMREFIDFDKNMAESIAQHLLLLNRQGLILNNNTNFEKIPFKVYKVSSPTNDSVQFHFEY